jgi:zinc D-Ala-D-Ala carboxypeptidase
VSNIDVAQWIQRSLPFDQLIYEFGEEGWVHVGWRPANLRHQELTARRIRGQVKYLPGLLPDYV